LDPISVDLNNYAKSLQQHSKNKSSLLSKENESNSFEYKCKIQVINDSDELILNQNLDRNESSLDNEKSNSSSQIATQTILMGNNNKSVNTLNIQDDILSQVKLCLKQQQPRSKTQTLIQHSIDHINLSDKFTTRTTECTPTTGPSDYDHAVSSKSECSLVQSVSANVIRGIGMVKVKTVNYHKYDSKSFKSKDPLATITNKILFEEEFEDTEFEINVNDRKFAY